jgi:hypothetical protein
VSTDPPTVPTIAPIRWSSHDPLPPGITIRDGLTYLTVPAEIARERKVGRTRSAHTIIEWTPGLVVITSDRRAFPYTDDHLAPLGLRTTTAIIPRQRLWSDTSIHAFLADETLPPNPATLIDDIRHLAEHHLEFTDPTTYPLLATWILATYVYRAFNAVAYLHLNGTAASGKSTTLGFIAALAYQAELASNISSAALFRTTAGAPGTILVDEAEKWDTERAQDLRQILNSGYQAGATVIRAERPNDRTAFTTTAYDTYGPKAIASINPLDPVIGSRCLVIHMRPALRRLRELDRTDPALQAIRDRLHLWALYHGPALAQHAERWSTELRHTRAPNLVGRPWQIAQAFIVIADYADQHAGSNLADDLITWFNTYYAHAQAEADATDAMRLLLRILPRVLATHAARDTDWYPLKSIHETLLSYADADAADWLKPRWIAKRLTALGFRERRSSHVGTLVRLPELQIRDELAGRRVDPLPEDAAWADGHVSYQTDTETNSVQSTRPSLWS